MIKKLKKYSSPICAGLAVLVIAGLALFSNMRDSAFLAVSGEVTNWGLSFQQEGQPPVANATTEYLQQFNALYCEPTQEKRIYITFDAGFENGNMPQILQALEKHHVKAVFFLVGNFMEKEPELLKQMVAAGHTIGNHTYSHPDMSAISGKESFLQELQKNENVYQKITGQDMPKLYRPPQGKYSEQNLQMANELGYKTVFWSLAYVDWYQDQQPTADEAFSKLIPRIHSGAVLLLHSTSSTNAQILDELLTRYEEMGYQFGNLEQYLSPKTPENGSIF